MRRQDEAARLMALAAIEAQAHANGYAVVAGIDEAGRGALAGPVVAAAVALPEGFYPVGLNDSKKMTPRARCRAYDEIIESALAFGVGMAGPDVVDSVNVLNATKRCMEGALQSLADTLGAYPDLVLVDALRLEGIGIPQEPIIKGDAKCLCIAAASVIAKVTRDRLMADIDAEFPGYGFSRHKGYGTKAHMEAIARLGPSAVHRRTFLRFGACRQAIDRRGVTNSDEQACRR